VASPTPISTSILHLTTTIDGTPTVWDFTKTIFPLVPDTTLVTFTQTIDGVQQMWTFTKTYSHLQTNQVSSSTTTISPTATNPTASSPASDTASGEISKAWIAGPVVGGVFGISAILLLSGGF
jgi:hypothetical protein